MVAILLLVAVYTLAHLVSSCQVSLLKLAPFTEEEAESEWLSGPPVQKSEPGFEARSVFSGFGFFLFHYTAF